MAVLMEFLSNRYLCWGVGPVLAYVVAFLLTALPLEILIYQPWMSKYLVTYDAAVPRHEAIANTQKKVSWAAQFKGSLYSLFGPVAIINAIVGFFLLDAAFDVPSSPYPTSWMRFGVQLLLMEIVGDFFLYWGHRIQHDIPYLWNNCHYLHHKLDTPTPISTIYIDSTDATLQGALPILFAALIVRPDHPVTLYAYTFLRIAENVVNHSGLNSKIVDVLTLKFLPLRASIECHDMHHKYSNYASNAKNYGENFWIWDYLFGTLRSVKVAAA